MFRLKDKCSDRINVLLKIGMKTYYKQGKCLNLFGNL